MEHVTLKIEGMSCNHCVNAVRGRLSETPGVKVEDVKIGAATIDYDPSATNLEQIEDAIADEGYTVAHD